jgi:hypothetical protein
MSRVDDKYLQLLRARYRAANITFDRTLTIA